MTYKFETVERVPFVDYDGTIAWYDAIIELVGGSKIFYTFYPENQSSMPDHISFQTHESSCEAVSLLPCEIVLEILDNVERISAMELLTVFYKYDKERVGAMETA